MDVTMVANREAGKARASRAPVIFDRSMGASAFAFVSLKG
jgi:hypothetical protein